MNLRTLAVLGLLTAVPSAQPPTEGEVVLPARGGWNAFSVLEAGCGVWYAQVADLVPALAPPEVIVADDQGRVHVLTVYSGAWTARSVQPDGQWLALAPPADVDPRVPGAEVYVAGKAGNVHRIWVAPLPYGKFELRSVEIGHAAGEEFHAILAGDLVPHRPGDEVWAFAISGRVFELVPHGDDAGFTMTEIARLPGRVRDALLLGDRVLAVSRSGHLHELRATEAGLTDTVILHEASGLGRITRRPRTAPQQPEVVYVTRDDGVLLRLEEVGAGEWRREVVFVGSQGPRGVAAGRFHADPAVESVAVYGYGKRVQLVSRAGSAPWKVETIYAGPDQGHWLVAGELDGRNATDELIAAGFDGRVVLLARPAGYGLHGVAVDDGAEPAPGTRRPRVR